MSDVEPGAYVVSAKTTLVQIEASDGTLSGPIDAARCTLNGDPSSNSATDDYAETELGRVDRGNETGRATLQTQVTLNLSSMGSLTLICRRGNTGYTHVARETKIIAVKLNSASRAAVTG